MVKKKTKQLVLPVVVLPIEIKPLKFVCNHMHIISVIKITCLNWSLICYFPPFVLFTVNTSIRSSERKLNSSGKQMQQ